MDDDKTQAPSPPDTAETTRATSSNALLGTVPHPQHLQRAYADYMFRALGLQIKMTATRGETVIKPTSTTVLTACQFKMLCHTLEHLSCTALEWASITNVLMHELKVSLASAVSGPVYDDEHERLLETALTVLRFCKDVQSRQQQTPVIILGLMDAMRQVQYVLDAQYHGFFERAERLLFELAMNATLDYTVPEYYHKILVLMEKHFMYGLRLLSVWLTRVVCDRELPASCFCGADTPSIKHINTRTRQVFVETCAYHFMDVVDRQRRVAKATKMSTVAETVPMTQSS